MCERGLKETVHLLKMHFLLVLNRLLASTDQNAKQILTKKEFCFSFKSFADLHYVFASTTGGGLLRKPMNQPLNGVAEIP